MATYMPVSGSFSTYATRFVDPAFGFALGWNYWFNWAVTLAVEIAAAAIIMKFWLPDVPSLIWSALFLGIVFTLNALSIKSYGESEYWFALIKVIAIICFIIIGLLTILGIFGGKVIGFENFTMDEAPFKGGFLSIISIFLIAGFSFSRHRTGWYCCRGKVKNPKKMFRMQSAKYFGASYYFTSGPS
ncbi:amino acid permease [Peribacillus frigoritolerans]|nr:amino acid permease [Peribacillus frigoritolerans]